MKLLIVVSLLFEFRITIFLSEEFFMIESSEQKIVEIDDA